MRFFSYSYGNGTGSWRRAVYMEMTDSSTNCPEGWNMTDYSKRTCGRATDEYLSCDQSHSLSLEESVVESRYQWGYVNGSLGIVMVMRMVPIVAIDKAQ